MRVLFGSSIEVIIDPRADLGESVRIVCALMYSACCFDFPAPRLSAVGGEVCVVWLSSPLQIMALRWVQAPSVLQAIGKGPRPPLDCQKQVHRLQL